VAESVCKVFIFLPDQKSIFFEKTFFSKIWTENEN
jgi:hypothetical protein